MKDQNAADNHGPATAIICAQQPFRPSTAGHGQQQTLIALVLAVLVRTGWPWVSWIALVVGVGLIIVSIFYYSPTVLPQRKPSPIDWFEDKVYTGLLFVAVALLAHDLLGKTLVP